MLQLGRLLLGELLLVVLIDEMLMVLQCLLFRRRDATRPPDGVLTRTPSTAMVLRHLPLLLADTRHAVRAPWRLIVTPKQSNQRTMGQPGTGVAWIALDTLVRWFTHAHTRARGRCLLTLCVKYTRCRKKEDRSYAPPKRFWSWEDCCALPISAYCFYLARTQSGTECRADALTNNKNKNR